MKMDEGMKKLMEELAVVLDPDGGLEFGRRQLYERGLAKYPHLPRLLMEWMQEFANERNSLPQEIWFSGRRPSEEDRTGLPPWAYYEDTLEMPPLDDVWPIEAKSGQKMLVWRDRDRTPQGYKAAVVKDAFFKADLATLAFLTTLEADLLNFFEARGPYGEREQVYARALLRYYRDDYDELGTREQEGLLRGTLERIYGVLKHVRDLAAYLEYGEPWGGLPKAPLGNPRLDVKAAELKHIEGLKLVEVGERLDIEKPKVKDPRTGKPREYDAKYDKDKYARKVSGYVKRGEDILKEALGDEGFLEHVKVAKKEIDCWGALSEEDRLVERLADMCPPDVARRIRHERRDALRDIFSGLLERGERPTPEELRRMFIPTTIVDTCESRKTSIK